MAETALNFASQIKLKEAFKDTRKRERYLRYYERVPSARPFCIGLRVIGISVLFLFFVFQASSLDNQLLLYWLAPAIAAIAAELAGRSVGKRYSTHVLLILLPALQIPGLIAKRSVSHDQRSDASGADKNIVPDEQIVDAAIEEIRVAIQDAASEGAIHHDERDMIEGVLEFEDVEVHEIMTPRTEMECIDINDKQENIRAHLADFHHTRIPIYEEVRDKVIGVLHVKDLVSKLMKESRNEVPGLKEIMQPPFFVPETKRAMSLLHDFKQRHLQIAIILDEYGGVTGMVTMEDIMEQIVGELEEGFEAERIEDRIRMLGGGALDVDARLHVDEINELLHADLPEDEDYETIGGFLLSQFATVPEAGKKLEYSNLAFEVLHSNERRVHRVLIKKNDKSQSGD